MTKSRVLAAEVLAPVAWTGFVLVVHDTRLPKPLGQYPLTSLLWAQYVITLAGLGAMLVWSSDEAPVVALVGMIVVG